MLRGLIGKTLRESWVVIVLACAGLAFVAGLLTSILPRFQEGLNAFILQMPFFRALLSGLAGIDVGNGLTPKVLAAVMWSHPVVLTIVWGFELVFCSRVPAGEIERGTIDVLLGWPVSRRAVYLAETGVWLAAGALLLACGFLGARLGAWTLPPENRPDVRPVLITLLNLFAVYVLVGGAALCLGAASNRRGSAMGFAFVFVLTSYLVNFLAQLWAPARRVAGASFVHYYQPARVFLTGEIPWRDILLLLLAGAVSWLLGDLVWTRRSVQTT